MTSGAVVLVVALVAAVAFGLWRRRTDGRFRGTGPVAAASPAGGTAPGADTTGSPGDLEGAAATASVPTTWDLVRAAGVAEEAGERATLLQFSTTFCTPCRATRRILGEVAAAVPGVRHVEVDAELHLQLTRDLDVLRTPTTLVLDARGTEVLRASGAPDKRQVLAALDRAVS